MATEHGVSIFQVKGAEPKIAVNSRERHRTDGAAPPKVAESGQAGRAPIAPQWDGKPPETKGRSPRRGGGSLGEALKRAIVTATLW